MRQAGRALPEYRALKEKHTFLELVQTPELAAEVTLQPIRRFGFDAAILFCDILVVAEGLGQRYQFRDRGGIEMEFLLKSAADIDRLEVEAVTERLQYVAKALPLIKSALGGRTALIGFAGSPWTLANFMIEGGGVKEYTKAKALFYSDPPLFARLLEKLTQAVAAFSNCKLTRAPMQSRFSIASAACCPRRLCRRLVPLDDADHRVSERQGAGDRVFQRHAWEAGMTWWPRARRCWAWIGMCAWRTCARGCPTGWACRAISTRSC
jgi:hypothetical protein